MVDFSELGVLALNISIIYGGIIAGFLLKKWSKSEKLGKWLTFAGINILTPVLLVFVILGIDDIASISWGLILLIGFLSCIFSLIIDWLMIRKKTNMTKAEKGAELSTVTFMNALFYPFPIILALVGTEGLLTATVFLIANMLLRNSLGVIIGVIFGSTKGKSSESTKRKSIVRILLDMFLFPPTLGMILGIILRSIIGTVPTNDYIALTVFQNVTMVIMLALVGLSFKIPKRSEWKEVALGRGIITRFGGGLLGVLILYFLPLPIVAAKIPLAIQSLSPPAVANTAYARYFELDDTITSRYITLLTLVGLIFLPLEIGLLSLWLN